MNPRFLSRARTRFVIALTVLVFAPLAATAQGWDRSERPSRADVPLPKNLHAPVVKASVADPTGDTFGDLATQIDIVELEANVVGNSLVIRIEFAAAISRPDSGAANAIDGFIDIDTDQDGSTGTVPFVDALTGNPTTGMGDEFYVDFFGFNGVDDTVDLVDDRPGSGGITIPVPISFDGDELTVTISLTDLADDGAVNIATVMGTVDEPTDVAPNQGSLATEGGGGGNPNTVLLGGRFEVGVEWQFLPAFDLRFAQASNLRTADSAIFFFSNSDNLEFLIKVIDGCTNNGHFWVFFAGATDVEFTVTVTDTQTREVVEYFNEQGHNADAITDTRAFATCP